MRRQAKTENRGRASPALQKGDEIHLATPFLKAQQVTYFDSHMPVDGSVTLEQSRTSSFLPVYSAGSCLARNSRERYHLLI